MKLFLFIIFLSMPLFAGDRYHFETRRDAIRFHHLLSQLRCLVCQNEDLDSSRAPLAEDLKKRIYDLMQQGASDQAIINYLTERYGNFILFRPPFVKTTWILWFAPFLMLMTGLIMVFFTRSQSS